ncbi:MAG: hypothetical protein AAF355_03960 [Myxococcota bacterium]
MSEHRGSAGIWITNQRNRAALGKVARTGPNIRAELNVRVGKVREAIDKCIEGLIEVAQAVLDVVEGKKAPIPIPVRVSNPTRYRRR